MGLLRTILIIVVIYYLIKVLSRIFAPFMLKYAAKKAEERFGGQFRNQRQQQEAAKMDMATIKKKLLLFLLQVLIKYNLQINRKFNLFLLNMNKVRRKNKRDTL